MGGGGSNNKKDHAAGKNPRCPLSFLLFFVLFQNTFKIDVFVPNLVKNVSSKKNKKDHDFCLFDLFCSFLLFMPDFVKKMSSNREQKRSCRRENRKMSFVFFSFLLLDPPPPPTINSHLSIDSNFYGVTRHIPWENSYTCTWRSAANKGYTCPNALVSNFANLGSAMSLWGLQCPFNQFLNFPYDFGILAPWKHLTYGKNCI